MHLFTVSAAYRRLLPTAPTMELKMPPDSSAGGVPSAMLRQRLRTEKTQILQQDIEADRKFQMLHKGYESLSRAAVRFLPSSSDRRETAETMPHRLTGHCVLRCVCRLRRRLVACVSLPPADLPRGSRMLPCHGNQPLCAEVLHNQAQLAVLITIARECFMFRSNWHRRHSNLA